VQALLKDLESELPNIWGRPIVSIFIGGGTPSLFSAKAIDTLLSGLRTLLALLPNIEITMEANPSTFEQERFRDYHSSGINRLSIGIQSFSNNKLLSLGRVHNGKEALHAAEIARNAGFENYNLDLMFGLPNQSINESLYDLQQAIDNKPTHISWYQLTIEENTLFHYSPPILPNDDVLWNMSQQGIELLESNGYLQYEVSAYSQKNKQCQHNLNYWQFGDYLGIGAGAHGKLTIPSGEIRRHSKYKHPKKYMETALKGEARSSEQILTEKDLCFEYILNTMRLKQGFSKELFEARTRISFELIQDKIYKLTSEGLIEVSNGKYVTTKKGWFFINDIVERFL